MKKSGLPQANLWIFGYGSLMWDGWENTYGCVQRTVADLPGYRRVFNKASVERWGSRTVPGPTLNLISVVGGVCRGMAFKFPVEQGASIRAYLTRREGPGFPLREKQIHLPSAESVQAFVPIYEGKNLVKVTTLDETATLACRAAGSGGRCIDYVKGIAAKLAELGIRDQEVTDLLSAVERKERALSTISRCET